MAKFILTILTILLCNQIHAQSHFINVDQDTTKYSCLKQALQTHSHFTEIKLSFGTSPELLDSILGMKCLKSITLVQCDYEVMPIKICDIKELQSLNIYETPINNFTFLDCLKNLNSLSIDRFECVNCNLIFPTYLHIKNLRLSDAYYILPNKSSLEILIILYGNFNSFPKQILNYKNLKHLQIINNQEIKFFDIKYLKKKLSKIQSIEMDNH